MKNKQLNVVYTIPSIIFFHLGCTKVDITQRLIICRQQRKNMAANLKEETLQHFVRTFEETSIIIIGSWMYINLSVTSVNVYLFLWIIYKEKSADIKGLVRAVNQRRTHNTMTKRRTHNTMTKRKSTNNDLQHTSTQKTKD